MAIYQVTTNYPIRINENTMGLEGSDIDPISAYLDLVLPILPQARLDPGCYEYNNVPDTEKVHRQLIVTPNGTGYFYEVFLTEEMKDLDGRLGVRCEVLENGNTSHCILKLEDPSILGMTAIYGIWIYKENPKKRSKMPSVKW